MMILDTRDHCSTFPLSAIFSAMDTAIFLRPFEDLLAWEKGIAHEYVPILGADKYRRLRCAFLEEVCRERRKNEANLRNLIQYISNTISNI